MLMYAIHIGSPLVLFAISLQVLIVLGLVLSHRSRRNSFGER